MTGCSRLESLAEPIPIIPDLAILRDEIGGSI
jgi:hypothetical protein